MNAITSRVLSAFALGLGLSVGVVASASLFGLSAATKPAAPPDVVEARSFKLVDGNGLMRGRWRVEEGSSVLTLFDEESNPAISLRAGNGPTVIQVLHSNGAVAVSAGPTPDGKAFIQALDNKKDPIWSTFEHGVRQTPKLDQPPK